MPGPDPAQPSVLNAAPPADLRERFLEALRRSVAPLAQVTQTAVACILSGNTDWVVASPSCLCSVSAGSAFRCTSVPTPGGRPTQSLELTYKGRTVGAVILCPASAASAATAALAQLVTATWRQIELESDNEALKVRLSGCWESLKAVYDISSSPPS